MDCLRSAARRAAQNCYHERRWSIGSQLSDRFLNQRRRAPLGLHLSKARAPPAQSTNPTIQLLMPGQVGLCCRTVCSRIKLRSRRKPSGPKVAIQRPTLRAGRSPLDQVGIRPGHRQPAGSSPCGATGHANTGVIASAMAPRATRPGWGSAPKHAMPEIDEQFHLAHRGASPKLEEMSSFTPQVSNNSGNSASLGLEAQSISEPEPLATSLGRDSLPSLIRSSGSRGLAGFS